MRTDVRSHLDESAANFWTDAELNRWINEGTRDIARRSETLQDMHSIPVFSGVGQYQAPNDVFRIHRVEYVPLGAVTNIYPLEQRSVNEMDSVWGVQRSLSQAYPSFFVPWGFPPTLQLLLYPIPSQSGNLNVWYYRLPREMVADTDLVELPEGWHDLVVLFCEYVALRKDGNPRFQEAKAVYEERLGEMIDLTRRWTDGAGYMTFQGSSNTPQWLTGGGGDWG